MGASSKYIGSSDGPLILGVPSYGSTAVDVWDRMMGFETGRQENAQMEWGLLLEPLILAKYAERTGLKLDRRRRRFYLEGYPYIGATVDARAPDRIVEAKFSPYERDYGEPVDGAQGHPQYVRVQVQHQMLVTGMQRVDVPVLLRGFDLRIFEVDRDETFLADYLPELVEWYERHIVGRTPPPLDDSESYGRHLRRMHPYDDGSEIEAPKSLRPVFRRLAQAKRDEKDAKHRFAAARSIVMATMGEATKLIGKDIVITWRRTRPREEVAWELVASAYRRLIEDPGADIGGTAEDITAKLNALQSLYTTIASERRFTPSYKGELAELVKLTPQEHDEEVPDVADDTDA